MSEAQLQSAIIEQAHRFGWIVAHFTTTLTKTGWRTPVAADGAGFPDLILCRKGRLVAAELKAEKGRVSLEQQRWIDELGAVSVGTDRVQMFVWRPKNWRNGDVEIALRGS